MHTPTLFFVHLEKDSPFMDALTFTFNKSSSFVSRSTGSYVAWLSLNWLICVSTSDSSIPDGSVVTLTPLYFSALILGFTSTSHVNFMG